MSPPRRAARLSARRAIVLLDANILIALAWPQHVHHALAHRWFGQLELVADARERALRIEFIGDPGGRTTA